MKETLEKIRLQPAHKKERLILIIVSAVIILLLIAWLIIGNATRKSADRPDDSSIINDITTQVETTKDSQQEAFPDLFNNQE